MYEVDYDRKFDKGVAVVDNDFGVGVDFANKVE